MFSPLDLTPEQLLTTTRAVRKRLDLDRAVEPELLRECTRLAIQGPSGSNRQPWQFIFVTDPQQRSRLAELYRQGFGPYSAAPEFRAWLAGGDTAAAASQQRVARSAQYLADNLHRVPVLLVPVVRGRPGPSVAEQAGFWGSILPAVWSFMLAARAYGLGTAWTTLHLRYHDEAAELLGLPAGEFTQAGLFPVAYTIGTEFRPAGRRDVDEVWHLDRYTVAPDAEATGSDDDEVPSAAGGR